MGAGSTTPRAKLAKKFTATERLFISPFYPSVSGFYGKTMTINFNFSNSSGGRRGVL